MCLNKTVILVSETFGKQNNLIKQYVNAEVDAEDIIAHQLLCN